MIKTARKFKDIEAEMLPAEITQNEYIKNFANTLMQLSNELTEVLEENDDFDDRLEIAEEYLPSIREFIVKTTGL